MPFRSGWRVRREGVTVDTLLRLTECTIGNPFLTLPLLVLALFTERGRKFSVPHVGVLRTLKYLLAFGLVKQIRNLLDRAALNNWTKDSYDWQNEIVVVTGGSDGIGKLTVQLLAEQGIKVAVLDVQKLTYEAPPSVYYFECDLASPSSILTACASVRETLGDPTVLINNAGYTVDTPLLSTPLSSTSTTFKVNTFSHYALAHEFLPAMVRTNHGMIVTIASIASFSTIPRMVPYASSKAAVLAFHEGLSAELATVYNAPKVRTVIVIPGHVKTKLFEGFDEGDGFMSYSLHPETVAEAVVKAVMKGESGYIVLPEIGRYIALRVRNWPLWMQFSVRKSMVNLMQGFRGRKVVQPTEEKKEGMFGSNA